MITHHYTLLDNMEDEDFNAFMNRIFNRDGEDYYDYLGDLPFGPEDPIKPRKELMEHKLI